VSLATILLWNLSASVSKCQSSPHKSTVTRGIATRRRKDCGRHGQIPIIERYASPLCAHTTPFQFGATNTGLNSKPSTRSRMAVAVQLLPDTSFSLIQPHSALTSVRTFSCFKYAFFQLNHVSNGIHCLPVNFASIPRESKSSRWRTLG
jgi:hypothetical protein